jgi:hypothetical protein
MGVETGKGGFLGHVQQMWDAYPGKGAVQPAPEVLACIQACLDCAQACVACADACIGEENPRPLARCIRLNQDCANLCEVTAKVFSRQTLRDDFVSRAVLQACLAACRACAEECEKHAKAMKHCEVCADACRACEKACDRLLAAA